MLPYLTALFVLVWRWNGVGGRCVLKATTKKGRQLFWGKKCIRVTWLEDFLTSKWPGSFTALAPPLNSTTQTVMIIILYPWQSSLVAYMSYIEKGSWGDAFDQKWFTLENTAKWRLWSWTCLNIAFSFTYKVQHFLDQTLNCKFSRPGFVFPCLITTPQDRPHMVLYETTSHPLSTDIFQRMDTTSQQYYQTHHFYQTIIPR